MSYDPTLLYAAVQSLAGVCDGARSEDGMGFNGLDTGFGRKMASIPVEKWSPKQLVAVHRMIRKYRGQLEASGCLYSEIPVPPPPPAQSEPVRTISYKDGVFTVGWERRDKRFAELLAAVKGIPGRRWNKETLSWTVPYSLVAVEPLNNLCRNFEIEVGDEVIDLWTQSLESTQAVIKASSAATAEHTVAGLGGELRPFQKAGVAYASRHERVIIADEMGLGKTVQALATIADTNSYPAVIVCPKSLKLNWARETSKWLPGKSIEVLNGEPGSYNADVTIIQYDALIRGEHLGRLVAMNPAAVIFDEGHLLKNYRAKRTVASKKLARNVRIRMILTGTPFLNRPAEIISPLDIIGRLEDVGGFNQLWYHHAHAVKNGFGTEFGEPRDLDVLNRNCRASCYIRRLKKDVLPELPAKVKTTVEIQLSNLSEYLSAEANLIAYLARTGGNVTAAVRAEHLVKIETLKQLAARGKIEGVREWVENFLESGEKLVLFAHHRDIQELLVKTFPGCASVRGDDDVEVRQNNVDRFQNDPTCRLIVCSLKAGGVGITLTAASNVAFVEQGWNPADMQQAEDRVHRIGQKQSVNVWKLLAPETIDMDIAELIAAKAVVVDAASDGNKVEETVQVLNDLIERLTGKAKQLKIRKAS